MTPRIEQLPQKQLIGKKQVMSIAEDKTGELWKSFMPRLKEIHDRACNSLYSLQVYGPGYFSHFNPHRSFEKWAAAEVSSFENMPADLEPLTLPGGTYAVFEYKGSNTDTAIFEYIFTAWLPNSDYDLDERPHFELLGERYKNGDPDSEEEIWIPVRPKC